MGLVKLIFVFLRSLLRNQAELATENLAVLPTTTFCIFMREFSPKRPWLLLIGVPHRRTRVLPFLLVIALKTYAVMIES